MMKKLLKISVLGELKVEYDLEEIELPASRKTRALLAYLALSACPVRREQLCELFWDLPDDPRAALRWALTKLRKVLDTPDQQRVNADRERVMLDLDDVEVDFSTVTTRLNNADTSIPVDELRLMTDVFKDPLLSGLDYAGGEYFQNWLAGEREDAHVLHINVMRRLATHTDLIVSDRMKWAQRWFDLVPYDAAAASHMITTFKMTGRMCEAQHVEKEFRKTAAVSSTTLPADFGAVKSIEEPPDIVPPPRGNKHRWRLKSQTIGFCKASDGVNIAYATVGSGRPLVKAANWLNHLELDWDSPIWAPSFMACAQERRFIRYDERGNGLSDWQVDELSLEAFVTDLETVVDALGLDRFPLLGISQGCAVSIEYAARHPERVSGLVLVSGYATGWRVGASPEEQKRREAVMTLTRHGWGTQNPAYRRIFSQTFMPDAKPEELDWFDEFQRQTTSPENAVRFQDAFGDIDVRDSLAKVQAPTIVFHSRGDQRISIDQGRALANGISGAEFVPLDSRNHILLGSEPAWQKCLERAASFFLKHRI